MISHSFTAIQQSVILLFCSLLLLCNKAQAQSAKTGGLSRFNVYADLGGGISRGLVSINVEGKLFSGTGVSCYLRGGLGGGGSDDSDGPGVLGAFTTLVGKRNNHFELNTGLFLGQNSEAQNETFYLPILDVGYRYQKPQGGFIFSAKIGHLGLRFGMGYAF